MSLSSRQPFLTFEGGDGAGKTTQIRLLSELLSAQHIPHIVTREPGGSPQAEIIRRLLVTGAPEGWDGTTEAFLMAASRRNHLLTTIWPALHAGKWVLCDRFADSTFAYQGYGQRLGKRFVQTLNRLTMGKFKPDLTFVFQLPHTEGIARKEKEGGVEDRFEKFPAKFHARVCQGYQALIAQEPDRCIPINAEMPIESIAQQILRALEHKGFFLK